MIEVFVNDEWVIQQPVNGDLVRKQVGAGDNRHYQIYTYSDAVAQEDKRITRLAFKNRMTQAERIAIRIAANTDAIIFDFMDLVSEAQYVDLSRADTQAGVGYLEAQGHLAAGRANEILTNPIQPEESI